jgi:hypothetical protein
MPVEISQSHPLGAFPQGSHDTWQFHFFSSELERFFTVRLWASNSVRQAWAWTAKLDGGADTIAYTRSCSFSNIAQSTIASDDSKGLKFVFEESDKTTHEGILTVSSSGTEAIKISFKPRATFFWHVPGQTQGVFHFPNLTATICYAGKEVHAFGYCKRYWGDYDGPWGYQFIQGIAADEKMSFWTADATFGDDEYNYFKVLNGETGELIQAEKTDTYHNNQRAFWRPLEGPKMEAELTECAKMEFFLTSDKQHSKLVERFGRVELKKDGKTVFKGFGFNEICFGTVA